MSEVLLHLINSFDNNNIWSFDIILSTIFYLLGALIFCEIITLNFFKLHKYTKNKTMIEG